MCVRIVFLNLGWLQLNGFIKSWPNKITAFGIILSVMKVYKFKTIQVQLTTVQLNQKKLVAKYLWLSYCFFYYKEMLIFRNLWSRKESSSGFASTSSSNARYVQKTSRMGVTGKNLSSNTYRNRLIWSLSCSFRWRTCQQLWLNRHGPN